MRAFVFLLILANLLFFAWTQGLLGASANPDALRVEQQLLAERVKVVARDDLPKEVARPEKGEKAEKTEKSVEKPDKASEKKMAEVCLFFADLSVADLGKLENLLKQKFPAFNGERLMTAGSGSFWVFIPPLPNKQEADRKAAELKKFQVPEFYVVQDPGPMRFAISLGIFSSREAAEERLENLRAKGVRSAKVSERDIRPATSGLEIRGPETQRDELRQATGELLPKNKPAACKAPLAAVS